MKSQIVFANEKLKMAFEKLKHSKTEEGELEKFLERAFEDIEKDATCGIQIPNKLIPKEYKKYDIDNLWKYNLPNAWRLLYSVQKNDIIILSIVLEWMTHKNYERRFHY